MNFNQTAERSLNTTLNRQEGLQRGDFLGNPLEALAVRPPSLDVVKRLTLAVGILSGEVSLGQGHRLLPDLPATAETAQPSLVQIKTIPPLGVVSAREVESPVSG